MDYQALSQWIGTIGGAVSLIVLVVLLPINIKNKKSETRLNNANADKSIYDGLKIELERLEKEYEEKLNALKERVKKLEESNTALEKMNAIFRVAAENLGLWGKIQIEIERIKG